MLTKEVIKSQTILATLSDEQLTAIATLSENDENVVIGQKTAEIYKSFDDDIKEVTGKSKPTSMKTYDFLKNTLKDMKTSSDKATTLETEIAGLKTDKVNLEKQIKEGSQDAALKTKVAELERDIADKTTTVTKLQADIVQKDADHQTALGVEANKNVDLKFATVFAEEKAKLKFKNIPEVALNAAIKEVENDIKTKGTPEFKDGKVFFRDADGNMITNPNNLQNPYSAGEMFSDALSKSELIEGKRDASGGGGGPAGGGGGTVTMNMSGVKSQHGGNEQIREYLKAEGVPQGSSEYQEKFDTLFKDNGLADLPLVDPS